VVVSIPQFLIFLKGAAICRNGNVHAAAQQNVGRKGLY